MSNSSLKSDEEVGLKESVQAQEIPVLLENDKIQNILEIRFLPETFRRPMFAAFLVGVTAFACPGMFSALNGLGAGGTAEPTISNISNAVTFGTIAVGGFLTGTITNQIGVKQSLLIGAGFYSPYAAALYISTQGNNNYKWFMPVSGFILGVSAAFLWIASSGILLGYPTVKDKGKAMSMKFSLQHVGGLVGGAISLGLNHTKTSSRSVTGGTLLALTFVMLIGIPAALLLPTPRQINRGDGSKVDVFRQPSIWHEFALLKKILLKKDVILLIPLFIYNQWYLSYQWNFNYSYFSLRGRALNSFLFYLLGTIGAWISGLFLDLQRLKTVTRARSGFIVFSIIAGASWILGLVVESQWKNNTDLYDWGDGGFGLGCFLFCLWGFMDAMYNTFVYWVVGTLSNKVNELSLLGGIVNGIGSLGSALAFAVSAKSASGIAQCAINAGLFFFSLPFFSVVVWRIKENKGEKHPEDEFPQTGIVSFEGRL